MVDKRHRNVKADADNQRKKFIDTARKLGCDEDEAAFEEKLRKLAKAKPPPKPRKSGDK